MTRRCAECLCIPVECSANLTCVICNDERCCSSAHAKAGHFSVSKFFAYVKLTFAAAIGIEVICISFAELGENIGLYVYGFTPAGIAIAYALGYALAGVATFLTILGRSREGMSCTDSCCSVLEHAGRKGFWQNFVGTLRDFAAGLKKMATAGEQKNMQSVLKSSLFILVTAESACIITAETVGIILYQHSLLLSLPLALLAGAFVIAAPQAYKKARAG